MGLTREPEPLLQLQTSSQQEGSSTLKMRDMKLLSLIFRRGANVSRRDIWCPLTTISYLDRVNASPIESGFVQVPNAPAGGLGKSGCSCHIGEADRGAVLWGAMLVLGVVSRLRRRGKRQRRVNVCLASSRTG
jgi:MYXO-CTERM domain-containing protein